MATKPTSTRVRSVLSFDYALKRLLRQKANSAIWTARDKGSENIFPPPLAYFKTFPYLCHRCVNNANKNIYV
ncbi:MAG: hypothetical protein LBS63_01275, partial [Prevotellaceae bacterium]|nr:hypothetical protein [Prevotellaceae bacterium]